MFDKGHVNAFVVLVTVDFYIPASNSLKVKRMVVKSLVERIRNKFNASVAEIAFQDKWQRATVALTMVSSERKVLESQCSRLELLVREIGEIDLLNISIEWI